MLKVTKTQNSHGYDIFIITTDEGAFEISFQNNLDLYWRYIYEGSILKTPEQKKFLITKENYFIYELFETLYNSIQKGEIKFYEVEESEEPDLNNKINALQTPAHTLLYDNGIISWHSDDSVYETSSCLLIEQLSEQYKITFKKGIVDNILNLLTYSVRISNSGSRYNMFNIPFMNMYNSLREYEPEHHQIHIEELIYQKKLIRKDNK